MRIMSRILLLATALAATVSSTRPLAQAAGQPAGAKATTPDIAGFRAGMPLADAYKLLKAYNPKGRFLVGEALISEISDKKLPHTLVSTDVNRRISDVGETIQLDVTLPPNPQVVWMVQREIVFERGKEVLRDQLMAGLREKYGPEPSTNPRAPVYWIFDEQGQRLPQASVRHCSSIYSPMQRVDEPGIHSPWPRPDAKPERANEVQGLRSCMPLTYINLAIGTASETLVRTMQISLIDSGLVSRAHQATYDQIMKVRGGQGAKELEQQKQRPIPKL